MRTLHLLCLAGTILLTGCLSMPEQQYSHIPNAFAAPPPPMQNIQPNFQSFGSQPAQGYENTLVYTPSGYVTKRCKRLLDGALHCL